MGNVDVCTRDESSLHFIRRQEPLVRHNIQPNPACRLSRRAPMPMPMRMVTSMMSPVMVLLTFCCGGRRSDPCLRSLILQLLRQRTTRHRRIHHLHALRVFSGEGRWVVLHVGQEVDALHRVGGCRGGRRDARRHRSDRARRCALVVVVAVSY